MRNRWTAVGLLLAAAICIGVCIGHDKGAAKTPENYCELTFYEDGTATCMAHVFHENNEAVAQFDLAYETRDDGARYILDVGTYGIKMSKTAGWASVRDAEIVYEAVIYRESGQYAEVPIKYIACVDSARFEQYLAYVAIDLTGETK